MKRIIGSVLALSLLASSGAFAAGQDQHDRDGDSPQDRKDHRDDERGPQQARKDDRRDDLHDNGRHEGPRHHQRGERLAAGQRGDRVPDYRKHGLKAPPRGHEWRRVDNQYVLIAVTTSIISSVIANSR